jgi:hypothetical protein
LSIKTIDNKAFVCCLFAYTLIGFIVLTRDKGSELLSAFSDIFWAALDFEKRSPDLQTGNGKGEISH